MCGKNIVRKVGANWNKAEKGISVGSRFSGLYCAERELGGSSKYTRQVFPILSNFHEFFSPRPCTQIFRSKTRNLLRKLLSNRHPSIIPQATNLRDWYPTQPPILSQNPSHIEVSDRTSETTCFWFIANRCTAKGGEMSMLLRRAMILDLFSFYQTPRYGSDFGIRWGVEWDINPLNWWPTEWC